MFFFSNKNNYKFSKVVCVLISRKLPAEEPRQCNERRVIRRIRIDPVANTATDVPSKLFEKLRKIWM